MDLSLTRGTTYDGCSYQVRQGQQVDEVLSRRSEFHFELGASVPVVLSKCHDKGLSAAEQSKIDEFEAAAGRHRSSGLNGIDLPFLGRRRQQESSQLLYNLPDGRVVKLADTADSKSAEGNLMSVQVRPRPPYLQLIPMSPSARMDGLVLALHTKQWK